MIEISINNQIEYYHSQYCKAVAINLLTFGYKQFIETHRIKKLSEYKNLCKNSNKHSPPDNKLASEFAYNQLIDCIRITICFENFMKSFLLLNGFIVHKLDKNKFSALSKDQFNRPIKLSEVLETSKWEINEKLDTLDLNKKYLIKGILKNTIGLNELLKPNYQSIFKFSSETINSCMPYFNYRNNLHYYMGESLIISESEFINFIELIKFINNRIVKLHNDLIDDLKKGEEYKLAEIIYDDNQ